MNTRRCAAIFVVFALIGCGTASWVARLPGIRDALELSISEVGFLVAAVSGGAVIGLVAAPRVLGAIGRRRSIGLSLVLSGVALTSIGLGVELRSIFIVFLAMAVHGFVTSTCDVAINVEAAAFEQHAERNLMPWFHGLWSVGTIIGAGLGAIAAAFSVPAFWHLAVVATLIVAPSIVFVPSLLPGSPAPTENRTAVGSIAPRWSAWREPRTLLLGLIALGMAFAEGSAYDWLAILMVDDHGYDAGEGAAMLTVFTVAMTAGRFGGVRLLDRFGRVAVLRVAGAAAAGGLALLITSTSELLALVGVVVWGLGASLGFPVAISAAADQPDRAASRVSVVVTIGYLAFLCGPPLVGWAAQSTGLAGAMWIVVGLVLLALAATGSARRRQSHDVGDSSVEARESR